MTQEFVTLPREVVEQALDALNVATTPLARDRQEVLKAMEALRAVLEQPKNHVPDAGNMVPAGWKLVPVEPNCSMVLAGERSLEQHDFLRLDSAYRSMLAAAPQPPAPGCKATKRGDHVVCDDCKSAWDANDKNPPACVPAPPAVDQPQANQPTMTPIAQRKLEDLMASGYTISGYSIYNEQKHQHGFVTGAGLVGWWKPEGVEYPQPKLDPLTDEQIDAIADAMPGGLEGFMKGWGWRQFAHAIEATHNIK